MLLRLAGGDDEQGKLARAITPSKLTFSPSFGPSQFSIRKVHTCKLHATFELVSNLLKGGKLKPFNEHEFRLLRGKKKV